VCWTGSGFTFAWASRAVGALPANQFRLVVAVPILLLLAYGVTGSCWPSAASTERVAWLAASGLIGLVLGDLGFFHALATIGPRLASVVMAMWPAFMVIIDVLMGHTPGQGVLLGILLTMLGVMLVLLRSREGTAWNPGLTRSRWALGVAGALLGALGQAGGYFVAGLGMVPASDLPEGVPPLQATVVRMVAGLCGMQLLLLLSGRPLPMQKVLTHRRAFGAASAGALMGPVVGVWLSMVARREASDNGVAAALMSTTPIFMMPLAAFAYRARIGWLGALGTGLAVAGAVVCVAGR
jgi:drug/metabolite transporter (DMT)-like permease